MSLQLKLKGDTVQKVAGTLRVPSAEPQKALLFEGYGTWNVPTTFAGAVRYRICDWFSHRGLSATALPTSFLFCSPRSF
jgi:hypothetical protein